jgi:uncharacterized protein with von Willebrand factor type A (vWA) domain
MTLAELIEAARELPLAQRYELVSQVLATTEPPADHHDEVDEAWQAEFRRRIDDIESGQVELVDGRETIRLARERLAERRAESGA